MRVFSNSGTGLLYAAGIGAMALLTLKFVGFISDRPPATLDGVANYGRILARNGLEIIDPATTGSVTNDAKKTADDKTPDKAAASERNADGTLKNPKDLPKPTSNNNIPNKNSKTVALDMPHHSLSPSEKALLERLSERREQLENRGRDMDTREKLLESTEKKIEQRINQLKELEEKAAAALAKKAEGEGQTLKNVVTMYEGMKPKDAAKVFDRLSLDVLVPLVVQMNPKKMSEVLAVMTPESAEKLTVALSQRAKSAEMKSSAMTSTAPLPAQELEAIDATAPMPQKTPPRPRS